MPTALDNGERTPRKLLQSVVARLLNRSGRGSRPKLPEFPLDLPKGSYRRKPLEQAQCNCFAAHWNLLRELEEAARKAAVGGPDPVSSGVSEPSACARRRPPALGAAGHQLRRVAAAARTRRGSHRRGPGGLRAPAEAKAGRGDPNRHASGHDREAEIRQTLQPLRKQSRQDSARDRPDVEPRGLRPLHLLPPSLVPLRDHALHESLPQPGEYEVALRELQVQVAPSLRSTGRLLPTRRGRGTAAASAIGRLITRLTGPGFPFGLRPMSFLSSSTPARRRAFSDSRSRQRGTCRSRIKRGSPWSSPIAASARQGLLRGCTRARSPLNSRTARSRPPLSS